MSCSFIIIIIMILWQQEHNYEGQGYVTILLTIANRYKFAAKGSLDIIQKMINYLLNYFTRRMYNVEKCE